MIDTHYVSNNGSTIVVMPTQVLRSRYSIAFDAKYGKNWRRPDFMQILSHIIVFKWRLKLGE